MAKAAMVRFEFPGLDGPAASEKARSLYSELRQDPELFAHLDQERTTISRDDEESQDFGATLIAVLGTPAVIILARAVRDWAERTGTVVEGNGYVIRNARSADLAAIAKGLQGKPEPKAHKLGIARDEAGGRAKEHKKPRAPRGKPNGGQ